MDLKEAKDILDNCRKDDVVRYKEAQKVFAESEEPIEEPELVEEPIEVPPQDVG